MGKHFSCWRPLASRIAPCGLVYLNARAFDPDVEFKNISEGKVKASGIEMVKALATEPWRMREFEICTVDRHRFMFGRESA